MCGNGYQVAQGDVLVADFQSSTAQGGLLLIPFSGSNDQYDFDDSSGSLNHVSMSMASSVGKTINGFWPGTISDGTGQIDFYLYNASIVSQNGTVTPIFEGQPVQYQACQQLRQRCEGCVRSLATSPARHRAPCHEPKSGCLNV